ncbi:MAG: glycerate kinase, partial [Clostridia bacterium]|nr:glycerate kinase [Clostridia bacterium]
VDALVSASDGDYREVEVCGPLGENILSHYGIISSGSVAVIEMSAAAGITLVNESARNPLLTTTYGVGELIKDAVHSGCRKFIIGIGGSATNDGGTGMLSALGYRFLDADGNEILLGARGLENLAEINSDNVIEELSECEFYVACDVTNPLCGINGCSNVYGPQKGANEQMIADMDAWLKNYANLTKTYNPDADPDHPGAGAAGGMGFAFLSYLNAKLVPGIDLVIEHINLESYIKKSDLVITGEGRLDGQSCMGKAPIGVAALAKKYGKPVIAFSGIVSEDAVLCNKHGIDAFFPILRRVCTSAEAMDVDNAYKNLVATATQVFLLIKAFKER